MLGLGVDESYEAVLSRVPALGYFDHPPLSFWMAAAIARLMGSEYRALLRLPFILCFAATTWLMFRLTSRLFGERAGFLAVLVMNLSPVFSVSTGGWILPDGPLDLGIVATALCLTLALNIRGRIEGAPESTFHNWRWWIFAGVGTGVALLSKYHAVFLPLGTLLFLATRREDRVWLRRPQPYAAAAVALLLASPVIIWNVQHDFASVRFQAGRATTHGLHLASFAQNVGGQLGYLFPWIGIPLLWQLVRGLRAGPPDTARWLLCCLAVGPIAGFTLVSLGGNPGLPHWPAPGYLVLFPLLGEALARYEHRGTREHTLIRRCLAAAAAVLLFLIAVAASDVATGWASRLAPGAFRRGDPSLEAVDWQDLPNGLRRLGLLGDGSTVIATIHWIDGAKAGYAIGRGWPVVCLSDDPRGFQFAYPPNRFAGRNAILLVRAQRTGVPPDMSRYAPYFRSLQLVDSVAITRLRRPELEILVYRGSGLRLTTAVSALAIGPE